MSFKLKLLPAALLLAGLSPLTAQAVVLPIIADTYLAMSTAGTSVAVNVNASNKALLNFDVSTLPAGITSADIAKATLVFFVKTVPTAGRLQVSPLTRAWTENTTLSTAPTAGLPLATSAPISKGNTYFAVDVTNLVLNWVDVPASNNGLALDPVGQTSLTFDSKEAIQTSHPAYIEIALKGPAGAVGHTGAIGSQGLQGVPGNPGSNGLNGAPGVNGLNGAKGDTGAFPSGTTVGDMQYWNGTAWVMIPTGADNANLKSCKGIPTWVTNLCPVVTIFTLDSTGPDGSSNFGSSVTSVGSHPPVVSTSTTYQGSNSIYFDGNAALVVNNPNLNIGLVDWEGSFAFKKNGAQTPYPIIVNGGLMTFGNTTQFQNTDNDWHQVLISGKNGQINVFVDGVLNAQQSSTNVNISNNMNGMYIGKFGAPYAQFYDNAFIGWIANFKITYNI